MRASHILNRSAIPYHSTGLTLSAILEPLEDRTIGIDDGGLGEFARFSYAGPGEGHADCSLWRHAFIVSEGLERRKAGSIAYEGFERDGDPTVIERKLVDGSLRRPCRALPSRAIPSSARPCPLCTAMRCRAEPSAGMSFSCHTNQLGCAELVIKLQWRHLDAGCREWRLNAARSIGRASRDRAVRGHRVRLRWSRRTPPRKNDREQAPVTRP